jgi:hypothetical protein
MSHQPKQNRRIIELRQHPRMSTPSSALASFRRLVAAPVRSEEELESDATLLELSVGGCRIHSETPLALGKEYSLILQLTGKRQPIRIETAVVRWIKNGVYGLKFLALPLKEESRIKELIREGHQAAE